jgi:hypothetical protein
MPSLPSTIIATTMILLAALGIRAYGEDTMQDAALGAKVFAENCSRCHEAPDPASRAGRDWRSISLHMRVISDLSREDQQKVLIFLRTFNTAAFTKHLGSPASR